MSLVRELNQTPVSFSNRSSAKKGVGAGEAWKNAAVLDSVSGAEAGQSLQRLGVGPGSVLEWEEEGDRVIVRKAGRYSSEDIHRALFSTPPRRRGMEELKAGIRQAVKQRHAGR
jgi:hypothetical protein